MNNIDLANLYVQNNQDHLKNRLKKLLGYMPAPSFCETCEKITMDFDGIYKSNPAQTEFNNFNFISNLLFRKDFQKKYSITKYEKKFKAIIPNALVFGYGAVISPDGISLARDVTPDFGADSSSHWILKRSAMWKRPRNLEGKILVAIHNLSKTYYHWLFEEIPRVLGSANDFEIALVSGVTRAQKDVIQLISEKNFNKKFLFTNGYETFRCEKLVVPSLPDRCNGEMFYDENRPSADTISTLREFAFSIPAIRASKSKKIFISRKNANIRRLLNEEQIISQLKKTGFQVYELEQLGFLEQVEIFQRAECIVSVHGSALANIVFCRPGTKLVEIFHLSYIKPMYAFIAMHLKLDYRPIISNLPPLEEGSLQQDCFSVNLEEIICHAV